jgi:hypothetical protein
MTRIQNLLPASWKGIPFFIRSEILTEGGRRIVLHDYPNSSERFVEDLGQLPPKFSITAFVTGEDFLERAEQLERALQEKGKGRLSMPTFGARNLFALPYRKDASQTEVGEIRFELEFVAGRAISGPSKAPNTIETVFSLGDTARIEIGSALEDLWIPPVETPNVLTAQFDLKQFAQAINQLRTLVNNVSDIDSIVNFIKVNAPSIVRSALNLKTTFINDLWQTVSVGLIGGFSILTDLTKFGSALSLSLSDIRNASISGTSSGSEETEIPLWSETTGGRLIRNKNRLSLVNAGRLSALVTAYEQAANTLYRTDVEIDQARLILENEHQRLMRVDTENRDLIQSQSSVRRAVENIRLAALSVLDQKEQAAYTLVNIERKTPISSFTLAYDLYAEEFTTSEEVTARGIEIRGLNISEPADKLDNNITVLQS